MEKTIDSFVSSIQDVLTLLEDSQGRTQPSVRRKMRTVARDCGWKARSTERIESLQSALDDAGIYTLPEITDDDVTMDTFVTFSRTDRAARPLGKVFGKEAGIQRFVQKYYADAFRGHEGLENLKLVGREVVFYQGQRKLIVDLVFKTPGGQTVIVELKRGDPVLKAPAQLRDYMRAAGISSNDISSNDVVGVLITAKPRTAALENAIREEIASQQNDYPISWYWYSVEVDLQPVT